MRTSSLAAAKQEFLRERESDHLTARPREYIFAPVANFNQFIQSLRLVYLQYRKFGFVEEKSAGLHFSLSDLLPETVTFIASHHQAVVGTLTTVRCKWHQLPSSNEYTSEMRSLRLERSVCAEGTKFAIDEWIQKASPHLSRELVRWVFHWWRSAGLDHVFVVVHPKHAAFWRRTVCFEPVGSAKPCRRVQGSPGLLLHLDLHSLARCTGTSSHGTRKRFLQAPTSFPQRWSFYRLSLDEIAILLVVDPNTLTEAPPELRASLAHRYPKLARFLDSFFFKQMTGFPRSGSKLQLRVFNVEQYFRSFSCALTEAAKAAGVAFSCEFSASLPYEAIADSFRLSELLVALVKEALTRSRTGASIRFTVELQADERGQPRFLLKLDGAELPKDNAARDMRLAPFSVVPGASADDAAPKLCELMGGSLRGIGRSTLLLELQAGIRSRSAGTRRKRSLNLQPVPESPQVLIAGLSRIEQLLFQRWLGSIGLEAALAVDGGDALRWVDQSAFELLILAQHMPGSDGVTTARTIRRKEAAGAIRPLKILGIVSSEHLIHDVWCSFLLWDDRLMKPVQRDALIEKALSLCPSAARREAGRTERAESGASRARQAQAAFNAA